MWCLEPNPEPLSGAEQMARGPQHCPHSPCLLGPQDMRSHLLLLLLQQLRGDKARGPKGALLPSLLPEVQPRLPGQHQLGHQPEPAQSHSVAGPGWAAGRRRPRSDTCCCPRCPQVPSPHRCPVLAS